MVLSNFTTVLNNKYPEHQKTSLQGQMMRPTMEKCVSHFFTRVHWEITNKYSKYDYVQFLLNNVTCVR